MTKVFDFSKALVRCSAIAPIMTTNERSPKAKYEYLCSVLTEEIGKYEAMGERKQGMKAGLSKAAKIAGLEQEIAKLEPLKHEDTLSLGAKSFLKRLYGELKYGKQSYKKEIGTKYTTKGKMVEQQSLELIGLLDGQTYVKNETRVTNEFISGVPDSWIGDSIYNAIYVPDVKSSWDLETFLENLGKPLTRQYWWQLQGYLDLTQALGGEVSYCLINTPPSIIEQERMNLAKRMDVVTDQDPAFLEAEAQLIKNLTFDDMSPKERRLKFEVNRDDAAIQRIHDKVPLCREYLAEIQELHLSGFFTDKDLPFLENSEEL